MKGVGGRVFENFHDLSFLAIGSRFGGGDRSFHSFHECCGFHMIRSLTSLHLLSEIGLLILILLFIQLGIMKRSLINVHFHYSQNDISSLSEHELKRSKMNVGGRTQGVVKRICIILLFFLSESCKSLNYMQGNTHAACTPYV
jgi:hypothetical protein